MKGETILHFDGGLLVLGVEVQNVPATSPNRTPANRRSNVMPPAATAIRPDGASAAPQRPAIPAELSA
jgi:hypothetical protein